MRDTSALCVYSFAHFAVDFCCFFMLYRVFLPVAGGSAAAGFLLYNALAFGLQPVVGYLRDCGPRIPAASVGCALLLAGLLLRAFPLGALILCALGNACFHIGGGVDSLRNAGGKMGRSGVFVSFGALGVLAGTLAGRAGGAFYAPAVALAVLFLALTALIDRRAGVRARRARFFITQSGRPTGAVLALALFSVAIRSFGGAALPGAWDKAAALTIALSVGAFVGKASGGFLADRFGARRVGVSALLLSIPLFLFSGGNPLLAGMGMALFQMTMPVTLCAVCDRLPDHPGLAFGLTTVSLLAGIAPVYFFTIAPAATLPVASLLTALSAGCALIMLTNKRRIQNEKAREIPSKQAV